MKIKELVKVISNATDIAIYFEIGKEPDWNNRLGYFGYHIFDEMENLFGDDEVLSIWPMSKDLLIITIKDR